jgi:hypothetical protein
MPEIGKWQAGYDKPRPAPLLDGRDTNLQYFLRIMLPTVDVTLLFSLRESAIAKEPGLGYSERWRCVSQLGASMVV